MPAVNPMPRRPQSSSLLCSALLCCLKDPSVTPVGGVSSEHQTMCDHDEHDPVELPITDTIDLHPFRPKEVKDVVRDYLDAAWERGLRELRIIHGRGIGVQRQTVRTVLERDPRVVEFGDAPGEAGGWGATLVRMAESETEQTEERE